MSAEHDNHGQTPAAWTLVVIALIGCVVCAVSVVAASEVGFFVGVGIIVVGVIVGKVMSMMASDQSGAPSTAHKP